MDLSVLGVVTIDMLFFALAVPNGMPRTYNVVWCKFSKAPHTGCSLKPDINDCTKHNIAKINTLVVSSLELQRVHTRAAFRCHACLYYVQDMSVYMYMYMSCVSMIMHTSVACTCTILTWAHHVYVHCTVCFVHVLLYFHGI